MKNPTIIAFLSVSFLISAFAAVHMPNGDGKLKWYDIEEVQKLVKTEPKKVFIDFTAKWCGWCKVMDKKTFTDAEVADYLNSNYYSVKLDFDSPRKFMYQGEMVTAKELARKNGITGLPTMLVASPDFSKVDRIVGYQKPKQFINSLKKIDG